MLEEETGERGCREEGGRVLRRRRKKRKRRGIKMQEKLGT